MPPNGRIREGMLIIPVVSLIDDHRNVSRNVETNGVYVVREVRPTTGGCSYSGENMHSHRNVLVIYGMPDFYCEHLFSEVEPLNCKHICKPFCMCLSEFLARSGRHLVDRAPPRHTPHASMPTPPRNRRIPGPSFDDILRAPEALLERERRLREQLRQQDERHQHVSTSRWFSSSDDP